MEIHNPRKNVDQVSNIGLVLLEQGKLNPEDAEQIIRTQKEFNIRFGDAAIKLGLVSEDDVLHAVAQQFDYTTLPFDTTLVDNEVIAAYTKNHLELESLRTIRSQLTLRWFANNKSLVVTGARYEQGVSHIVANLGVMFSQLGQKTLVIDADMRNPKQHLLFKLPNKHGLSEILANRKDLSIVQNIPGLDGLDILTSGATVPNPLDLLARKDFMSSVEQNYDVILIDTPPALESADAQLLASKISGALIIARNNFTKIKDIEVLKSQMQVARANIVGVVINEF